MSVIIIPRRHLTQPQGVPGVNWNSPLSRGLILATYGGHDAVSGARVDVVRSGLGFRSSALRNTYSLSDDTPEFTLIADVQFDSNNGDWASFDYGYYVSAVENLNVGIGLRGDSNVLYATCRKNIDVIADIKSVALPYAATLAISGSLNTGATVYENGLIISSVSPSGSYAADARRRVTAFTNTSTGKTARWLLAFKRRLSDAEIKSITDDPWQIFRADPIRIYSLPSGAITINSITASNITSSGARITLGLTR